jgi:transcriptional regulator with XRE-family HTH domain
MKFSQIIMNLRKEKGWTQSQLATKSGVSQVMIGKYERGDSKPSFESAINLSLGLGVSLETLAGLQNKPSENLREDLLNRMKGVEELDPSTQSILMNVIDTYIRDYHARKPYQYKK